MKASWRKQLGYKRVAAKKNWSPRRLYNLSHISSKKTPKKLQKNKLPSGVGVGRVELRLMQAITAASSSVPSPLCVCVCVVVRSTCRLSFISGPDPLPTLHLRR